LREVAVSEGIPSSGGDELKPGGLVRLVHLPKDEDANALTHTGNQDMIINEHGVRDRKKALLYLNGGNKTWIIQLSV